MSLIDDQRAAIEAEIKKARREQRLAEQAAETERAIYKWSKANPNLAFEANYQILREYLAAGGIEVSGNSLDLARNALRHQLAERPPVRPEPTAEERLLENNERLKGMSVAELRAEVKADKERNLARPENGGWGSVYTPDFTAKEFLHFSAARVKEILFYPDSRSERPGVRAGLDKLLRDAGYAKSV